MNSLKKLWVFGGASILVLAGAAMPGKILEEPFHDPIIYEKPVAEVYEEAQAADEGGESFENVKTVKIHYYNTDKKNNTREIYTWMGSTEKYCKLVPDAAGEDFYYHIELDYTGADAAYAGKSFLNFIVKYEGTWSGQSLDTRLEFAEFPPDSDGLVEVWICPGKSGSIEIYGSKQETQMARVSEAYFSDWKTIKCVADEKPKVYRLYAYDKAFLVSTDAVQQRTQFLRLIKQGVPSAKNFDIKFSHLAHINVQYVVETEYESHQKVQSIIVSTYKLYNDTNFEKYYNYKGSDLGCTYAADKTIFKVWAPTAGAVLLNVYNKGTPKSTGYSGASDIKKTYFMTMEPGGVWTKTLLTPAGGDSIEGKYYTYTVYNSEGVNEVCDPYAKACGVNGLRGMILDFSKTNPENWDKLPLKWDGTERDITTPQQLSIYEVHIRDLTEDKTWTGNARRGSYKAFYEKGTTYTGKNGNNTTVTVKTGFDHIEEMNVNTVQIMPMFDHDNAELYYYTKDNGEQVYVPADYSGEYKDKLQLDFNWGYNPQNYNCIEGSYSSNPEDGAARVKEFKELVYAYANNKNKTRITMDVVYNHVSSVTNSNFTKLMPRYYFRFNEATDEYWDGSGCSNEVKSEAPMMSKFIVDSLCWWAKEYKVKGFRFDLMELIDTDTLNEARKELYKIDPDIYLYGEGWKAADSGISAGKHGASTENTYKYCKPGNDMVILGCFNDGGRDAIKGGNDGGNVGHANFEWKSGDAPTTKGGYKYYQMSVGGWSAAGAEVWIHAWKSDTDNYDEKLTDLSQLKIRDGYNNFLLVRAKPGATSIPWEGNPNHWGKSADMTLQASGTLAFKDWGSVRTPGCWSMMSSGSEGSKVCTMMEGFNGNTSVSQDARQTVNYASCHDNFTLYDQFSWNLGSNPNVAIDGGSANVPPQAASVACALASTEIAIAMSNGVAFMLGGDELMRTKIEDHPEKSRENEDYVKMYGKCISHNSYKSSVQCNSFKWDRKIVVIGYTGMVNDMSDYWKPIAKAFELRNTIKDFAGANVFYGGSTKSGVGFYGGGYVTLISGKGNNSDMHGSLTGSPLLTIGTVNGASLGYWSAAVYKAV